MGMHSPPASDDAAQHDGGFVATPTGRPGSLVGFGFLKLGMGEAAARVIAFGTTIVLARTLGAPVYGVIVLATAILLYLAFLTDCGVDALGVREVAADPAALPETLPSILGARLLVGTSLAVLTAAVGLIFLPEPEGAILAAYAFTLPALALGTRWVHLGLEQPGHASIGRALTELVALGLVLILVRDASDIANVPIAQIAGEGAGAFVLLSFLRPGLRRLRIALDPGRVVALFRVSWPLIVHAILGLAIFNSDFIALRVFRDSAAVGVYAAAYTLISFFLNLGATYTMTLLPVMTRLRNDLPAARTLHDDSLAQVLAGAIPVAIGGFLVAPRLVGLVFGADYLGATTPLRILLWSIPVALIRNVSQGALIAYQRQDQLMQTAAWAAGINLVLNVALIPAWGLEGAAVATLATEVVRTHLAGRYARRLGLHMPGPWRFRRVVLASLTMGAVVWLVRDLHLAFTICAGALVYVTVLTVVGGIHWRRGARPGFTP